MAYRPADVRVMHLTAWTYPRLRAARIDLARRRQERPRRSWHSS